MTIYDLKPKFQNLLRPLVKVIWRSGITPNQITSGTCLLSVFVGVWLFHSKSELFIALPFFFFFRMALNAIDGMLAKEHNLKSPLGAILNEMTDVISDGFLYYAFSKFSFINLHLLMFVIFFSAVSEITGVAALLNQAPRQYSGPMGKSDRAFVFGVLALFVSGNVQNPLFYNATLTVISGLLLKTIYNRTRKSLALPEQEMKS
ncbi:MAG: CDP-alcohol phosphatidyltransferase family protein [Bacteriovorax sp.]